MRHTEDRELHSSVRPAPTATLPLLYPLTLAPDVEVADLLRAAGVELE